jgi:hypothetical protein
LLDRYRKLIFGVRQNWSPTRQSHP